jgi:hypothetical protein
LRAKRSISLLALLAMLAQAVFAMEHVSAMAVAAARGGSDGSPLGILEICTAQGLLRIRAPLDEGSQKQSPPGRNGAGESCVLCSSASITGAAGVPLGDIAIIAIERPFQVEPLIVHDQHVPMAGPRRAGDTRGPPAIFS